MVVRLLRHRRRLLTPQRIQRPRLDQSSRFLSSGCSWPFLPRRRGARLLATATPPAKLSGQRTAALAGKESFGPAPLRSFRLGAEPSGDLFAIGGTRRSCSVRYVTYADDGTVTTSASPANVWFPTPENRDEINGPDGTKDTPCHGHAIGLASLSLSRALVMCDDGTAMSSSNSGKTWRQLARIPDALAVTAGSGRYWVAAAHEGCDGVTVQSLTEESGSLTRGGTRCAAGLEVAAGQVAFDVTDDGTIWLWSGSRVVISRDDGQTWK